VDTKPINKEYNADTGDYASVRRGQYYRAFVSEGIAEEVATGDMTVANAASLLGCTPATVSRMFAAYKVDSRNAVAAEDWELSAEAEASLENFSNFRHKYFRTELGKHYDTAAFHTNWINNIIDSIEHGKELLILSPPRHGKTELLIHFAVYQICKNPNVRIMWVGGNEDIAKNALSAVLDVLDTNEELREDFCPPGQSFKPDNRSGKNWSQNQFTVGTRTVAGIKSPTMVAVGKGGKILSRDCDIIIADDIEDHQTTMQPGARENTRQWWTTTLSSRKEEHTAVVVIGSRQHPDDLYSHLVDNESWSTTVEQAHDIACTKSDWENEAHQDCMLWANKRTYKWLMDRKKAAETTGGRAIYEMVYLNVAMPDGMSLFDAEEIEQCRDQSRDIGHIPHNVRLIAGLDPASTGYQAAFLWGYNQEQDTLYMIDMENNLGGGIPKALEIIQQWFTKYNLAHWVIEENGFQRAIRQDKSIRDFAAKHGIFLEGTQTYGNKHDPIYGVTAMRPLFEQKLINLPYRSFEAQEKVNLYRSQLVYFSSAQNKSRSVGTKSDIVMASWFPMKTISRLQKERLATMGMEYQPSFSNYEGLGIDLDSWR
jgi:hypothetical protein